MQIGRNAQNMDSYIPPDGVWSFEEVWGVVVSDDGQQLNTLVALMKEQMSTFVFSQVNRLSARLLH